MRKATPLIQTDTAEGPRPLESAPRASAAHERGPESGGAPDQTVGVAGATPTRRRRGEPT